MPSLATSQSLPFLATPAAQPCSGQWEEILPGKAWVATRFSDILSHCWGGGIDAAPFDQRYYALVEETISSGFRYRYAILHDVESDAWCVQPFFLVDQDLGMGLPAGARVLLQGVRRFFPRFMRSTLLMVGNAAGEGVPDCREAWAIDLLHIVLEKVARQIGASLLVFKDFPSRNRALLQPLERHGYRRVPSMPGAELALEEASFEEYMQRRLGRISRKGLRRKFRECERFGGVFMEQCRDDFRAAVEEIYPLYRQTFERSRFRFEELTPEYFHQMLEQMGDRARLFIWRYEGRAVAFSLCLVHGGVLYDMNVGLDYSVALRLHLYFITWRDIVSWAMKEGLKSYYTGPLNYEPKLHFRLKLAPLDLYVRHRSRWLNPLFGTALEVLHPTRYEAILRRFPNADELW